MYCYIFWFFGFFLNMICLYICRHLFFFYCHFFFEISFSFSNNSFSFTDISFSFFDPSFSFTDLSLLYFFHAHIFFLSYILLIILFTFQKITKFILIPCGHHYYPPKVYLISMSTLFNTPYYASHYSFSLNSVTLHNHDWPF